MVVGWAENPAPRLGEQLVSGSTEIWVGHVKAAAAQSRLKGTPGREPSAKKRPALATPGAAPAITPSGLDTIGGLATTASKRRLEQSSGSKSRRGLDRRDPAVRPLLPVFDVGVGGHVDNSGGAGGDFSGGAGGDC